MSEPQFWYYYLHTNGDLIGRNPVVVDSDPQYFNSPFVKKHWRVDLTDRTTCWKMILEALEAGAKTERIKELAKKWKMDFDDSLEFLKRFKPENIHRDGMEKFIIRIFKMDPDDYWEKVKQQK